MCTNGCIGKKDGVLNEWLKREASHVGMNIEDLEGKEGFNIETDLIYSGYFQYE